MKQDQMGHAQFHRFDRKRVRLDGVSQDYDARVHAIRPDLADVALAGLYFAPHYAQPVQRGCVVASAALREAPSGDATAVSELLHGEAFYVLDVRGGWAWGYCGHDHYVGYVVADALGEPAEASHVAIAAAPLFSAPDIKSALHALYPAHAKLSGRIEGNFLATGDGFVHARHVRPLGETASDWVTVAQRHMGAPYVWGGRGGLGLDCSGLVQVALAACGIEAPRDTDQQAQAIGSEIAEGDVLRRGDIIFFPGHVGLMADETQLLHANAHWMAVTIEPLSDVIARLGDKFERPVTARRRIE